MWRHTYFQQPSRFLKRNPPCVFRSSFKRISMPQRVQGAVSGARGESHYSDPVDVLYVSTAANGREVIHPTVGSPTPGKLICPGASEVCETTIYKCFFAAANSSKQTPTQTFSHPLPDCDPGRVVQGGCCGRHAAPSHATSACLLYLVLTLLPLFLYQINNVVQI